MIVMNEIILPSDKFKADEIKPRSNSGVYTLHFFSTSDVVTFYVGKKKRARKRRRRKRQ